MPDNSEHPSWQKPLKGGALYRGICRKLILQTRLQKDHNMEDDRREFTRFAFKTGEIQILSDDPILFGKIHNLSIGGLSFQYTPVTDEKLLTKSINILPKDKDQFNLYHIECRTIYDMSFIEKDQSLTGYQKRKCGVEFYWLKEEQNDKLRLLLTHYAVH